MEQVYPTEAVHPSAVGHTIAAVEPPPEHAVGPHGVRHERVEPWGVFPPKGHYAQGAVPGGGHSRHPRAKQWVQPRDTHVVDFP
eukprot:536841-Rhodomonas_salina.1